MCEAAIPGKNTQNKTIVPSFIVIIILLSLNFFFGGLICFCFYQSFVCHTSSTTIAVKKKRAKNDSLDTIYMGDSLKEESNHSRRSLEIVLRDVDENFDDSDATENAVLVHVHVEEKFNFLRSDDGLCQG